jgi:two-component system, NarL family, nitrate/nitrite response regulator NarL
MTSVLLVDNICLSREGLAAQLRHEDWASDVRTAADASSAVDTMRQCSAEVVLVSLASTEGLETLAIVRAAVPSAPVVVFAVSDGDDEILRCAEAGVAGFVPRDGTLADLSRAVAAVMRGEIVCPPPVVNALMRRMARLAAQRTGPIDDIHLTPREREVLVLIEQGMTNKQIAQRLNIEVRTVKNHVHNLLEKLRVHRRGEAAARLRSARVPATRVLRDAGEGTRSLTRGY